MEKKTKTPPSTFSIIILNCSRQEVTPTDGNQFFHSKSLHISSRVL